MKKSIEICFLILKKWIDFEHNFIILITFLTFNERDIFCYLTLTIIKYIFEIKIMILIKNIVAVKINKRYIHKNIYLDKKNLEQFYF